MGKTQKPISYYAKYLGGHPRYPGDEDIGVYIHSDLLELAFKGHSITIPFSDIKNITNIDKGKVFDGGNTAVGLMVLGPFGLLMMRRKVNAMLIEYDNDKETSNTQTVALDFWGNVKHAQPIIYDRMVKAKRMSTPIPTPEEPTRTQEQQEDPTRHIGGPFNK
jgi:hypothetical protein